MSIYLCLVGMQFDVAIAGSGSSIVCVNIYIFCLMTGMSNSHTVEL